MPMRLALFYYDQILDLQREEARVAATAVAVGSGTLRPGDARAILADWGMRQDLPETDMATAAAGLGLEGV